jgi:flagellar basal body-associated protein FliL
MENFFPDLPARCAAVAAGRKEKKKKKKRRGRKETTGKCGRVRGGECGSELVVPLLVVVVVVVIVLCVCVFYFGSLVVTIFTRSTSSLAGTGV